MPWFAQTGSQLWRPSVAIPSIRPSTWAGTPATMWSVGVPRRSGHARRTRSREVADDLPVRGGAARGGVRCQDRAADPRDHAVGDDDLVDAVSEGIGEASGGRVDGGAAQERLEDARPRAPGQVEAGDGVAVPIGTAVAALGPADDGEEPHAHPREPGALLTRGEVDVGLGPAPGPVVLGPVEPGRSLPVGPRELT